MMQYLSKPGKLLLVAFAFLNLFSKPWIVFLLLKLIFNETKRNKSCCSHWLQIFYFIFNQYIMISNDCNNFLVWYVCLHLIPEMNYHTKIKTNRFFEKIYDSLLFLGIFLRNTVLPARKEWRWIGIQEQAITVLRSLAETVSRLLSNPSLF